MKVVQQIYKWLILTIITIFCPIKYSLVNRIGLTHHKEKATINTLFLKAHTDMVHIFIRDCAAGRNVEVCSYLRREWDQSLVYRQHFSRWVWRGRHSNKSRGCAHRKHLVSVDINTSKLVSPLMFSSYLINIIKDIWLLQQKNYLQHVTWKKCLESRKPI